MYEITLPSMGNARPARKTLVSAGKLVHLAAELVQLAASALDGKLPAPAASMLLRRQRATLSSSAFAREQAKPMARTARANRQMTARSAGTFGAPAPAAFDAPAPPAPPAPLATAPHPHLCRSLHSRRRWSRPRQPHSTRSSHPPWAQPVSCRPPAALPRLPPARASCCG